MPCSDCCDPDQVRDGCGDTGAFIEGHCCKCLPRRVCVSLFLDTNVCETTDFSAYESVSSVEASWCEAVVGSARAYQGTLSCGEADIDFSIAFTKNDYNECHLCLTSTALGYTGPYVVCLPMGGYAFDPAIKRAECTEMSFSFPIEYGGTTGEITINPADYSVQTPRRREPQCFWRRVCITVDDGYAVTVLQACFDTENGTWQGYVDDDPSKPVTITLESEMGDPNVRFSLTSYLGNGDEQAANCPKMYGRWDLGYGVSVRIIGDEQAKCTDCRYHCRCLCVTFSNGIDTIEREITCASTDYDGCETLWHVTIGGYALAFTLTCTGCETLTSVLTMETPYGVTMISANNQGIVCPDRLNASWFFDPGDDTVVAIEVACKGCGDQCTVEELGTTSLCCPYRDRPIPLVLYATIESQVDCPDALGVVFTLTNNGPTGAPSNCWTGTKVINGVTQRLSLSCLFDETEGYDWYLSGAAGECIDGVDASRRGVLISCDPLEITFTVDPFGACGITSNVSVRVTE